MPPLTTSVGGRTTCASGTASDFSDSSALRRRLTGCTAPIYSCPASLCFSATQLTWPTSLRNLVAVPELLRALQPAAKLVVRRSTARHNHAAAAAAAAAVAAAFIGFLRCAQVILRDPVERAASQYRNDCSDCEHAWKPLRPECACPISAEAFEAAVNATVPVLEARAASRHHRSLNSFSHQCGAGTLQCSLIG